MPATHKDAIAAVEAFASDRDPPLTPAEAAAYAMGFLSGVKSWSVVSLLPFSFFQWRSECDGGMPSPESGLFTIGESALTNKMGIQLARALPALTRSPIPSNRLPIHKATTKIDLSLLLSDIRNISTTFYFVILLPYATRIPLHLLYPHCEQGG
jgi:hypothetical protein